MERRELEEMMDSMKFDEGKAFMAVAFGLHEVSASLERIGFNGAVMGGGSDQRGCLEKLAADLPEAVGRVADSFLGERNS